jgi:5-methylcytosine-specific restriction endonuclease McrA
MNAVVSTVAGPGSLPSSALAARLAALCSEERNVQADFLIHLDEFDRRRDWAAAGYGSLWTYCLEVLHLRESAAGRRIGAMKALRRFSSLEAPLRDGRLCLSTVNLLASALTDENVGDLVQRAAYLSKAETERLAASIRPRIPPRDGVRLVRPTAVAASGAPAAPVSLPLTDPARATFAVDAPLPAPFALETRPPTAPPPSRPEVRPVSADAYSLRVTIDSAWKAELDQLVALLSHSTRGDLAEVLREAIRCGIAKHGKRKGAVAPERRKVAPASSNPRSIPAEVKRAVWTRDDGCCAWVSSDGKRCASTWKLQFGHIQPVARGGRSTVGNVRLECASHNAFEALRVFGREHMAPYLGAIATPGGSDSW